MKNPLKLEQIYMIRNKKKTLLFSIPNPINCMFPEPLNPIPPKVIRILTSLSNYARPQKLMKTLGLLFYYSGCYNLWC